MDTNIVPLHDYALGVATFTRVLAERPRLRNWDGKQLPTVDPKMHGRIYEYGSNRDWSKRSTFRRGVYYHSALRLVDPKTVELHQAEAIRRRIVLKCRDLKFLIRIDSNELMIAARDGTEYHPTAEEWKRLDFVTHCRAELSRKRAIVAYENRQEAAWERQRKTRELQMPGCRVTLEDSRRAGNCVEGSLQFAARRLGLDRDAIVAGQWLFGVEGAKLLATDDPRARAAVEQAWRRETMICI